VGETKNGRVRGEGVDGIFDTESSRKERREEGRREEALYD